VAILLDWLTGCDSIVCVRLYVHVETDKVVEEKVIDKVTTDAIQLSPNHLPISPRRSPLICSPTALKHAAQVQLEQDKLSPHRCDRASQDRG
jgi:hypothetical protein